MNTSATMRAENSMTQMPAAAAALETALDQRFWQKLLRVAWLSILLGLLIEALVLLVAALTAFQSIKPFIADLVQKISWSSLVCVGLAVGTASAKGVKRMAAMGLLGLLSAPLAFTVARTLHRGAAQALSLNSGTPTSFPYLIAGMKALEYGCLGILVAWIATKVWGGLRAHALTGLGVGAVFGSLILVLMVRGAVRPLSTGELLGRGVSEIVFPVGCAVVLYAADALGKRMAK